MFSHSQFLQRAAQRLSLCGNNSVTYSETSTEIPTPALLAENHILAISRKQQAANKLEQSHSLAHRYPTQAPHAPSATNTPESLLG